MTAPALLVVLEDTPGRLDRMREVTDRPIRHFARAADLLAWLATADEPVALMTLDYHLASPADGTGLDVALGLSKQPPRCPVIVHSSDRTGAAAIAELLASTGWIVECVPFERDLWAEAVQRHLAGGHETSRPASPRRSLQDGHVTEREAAP